jgi:uncharacterized protein YegL
MILFQRKISTSTETTDQIRPKARLVTDFSPQDNMKNNMIKI